MGLASWVDALVGGELKDRDRDTSTWKINKKIQKNPGPVVCRVLRVKKI